MKFGKWGYEGQSAERILERCRSLTRKHLNIFNPSPRIIQVNHSFLTSVIFAHLTPNTFTAFKMQFSSVLFAAAALAVANAAQFTMTASQFVSVKTGTAFDLTWSNATGPVTLLLKNGPANDLKTVETIGSGLTGTSFSWTPESSLVSGTYAFEIDDTSGPNYSVIFTLAGSASSVSSSASSTGSSSSGSTTASITSGSTTSSSSSSSATPASNSTSTTNSSSKTASKTSSSTGTSTSSTTTASSLSSASGLASPLAFVFLALAAIMTLN
ncbi:hypothetical protein EG329_010647 [Mollisiaceae sp. DMI_Dod_QoI]|nr:hypothetical protein EG329_010647 [Helotiales sp. DMI_Dod_QoI]